MVRDVAALEGFWQRVTAELDPVRPEVELQRNTFYSEPEWDVFQVRYRGLGGYQLFAWLSVPHGGGPFPGLVLMPDYASAVDINYMALRQEAAVLSPSYRGQRRCDTPFRASYPGLLTHGIEHPETCILREVYADALRGVDVILEQSQVDTGRIALAGAGLGGTLALAAAAFRPQVVAIAVDTPIMIGVPGVLDLAGAYPLEEVKDFLRTYPDRSDGVLSGLGLFSPVALAGMVDCPALLSTGTRDRGQCPPPLGGGLLARLKLGELRQYPGGGDGGGHQHGVLRTRWLRDHLGIS